MKLAQAIAQVPKSILVIGRGEERHTNFPGIFKDAVKRLLTARGVKFSEATVDAIADHVNISTFQRSAALAASNHLNGVVPATKPKKEPKLKAKRGVDPISGKTKKEEAAEKKAAKEAAKAAAVAEKRAQKAAKAEKPAKDGKAPSNPEFKAAKEKAAAEKKAAKSKPAAAPKAEVDPITGDPITA